MSHERLCLFAPIVPGCIFRAHWLFSFILTKTLVVVYPPHFTAPKGGPGLLNFLSSKADILG